MRQDIYFDSCGVGKIHACVWSGEEAPRGIVQIVHGIAEHVLRYDDFASYLVKNGYAVVAEDHMGHGGSVTNNVQGYFSGGWLSAVKDTVSLMEIAKSRFGNIPYILFGHSMGSFMVRTILADYPQLKLSGSIICGTGWQSQGLLSVAIPAARTICKLAGEDKPSKVLQTMAFGSYNSRVEHKRTIHDWLSRDDRVVDIYEEDPLCGFVPSAGLMRDMLCAIRHIQQQDTLSKMDKTLPCYFIAGGDDPVGEYGTGVHKAVKAFKDIGMQNVSCKIYPLCRHEILNEINRQEVYEDILSWINGLI